VEIEGKNYEQLFGQMLETFRQLDAELTACRWFLSGLKELHPKLDMDRGLEFVKTSPSFQKYIRERADLIRNLRESVAESRDVWKQLDAWKLSGLN